MSYYLEAAAQRDPQRASDLARSDAEMRGSLHPVFVRALAPFAPAPAHSFTRIGGTGLDDAKVPTCSCGWRGRPVEGWRNDQSLQLAAQEYQHRMDGVTPQALREGGVL